MAGEQAAGGTRALHADALRALADASGHGTGTAADAARALEALGTQAWTLPGGWWLEFDRLARSAGLLRYRPGRGFADGALPEPWRWALEVCAADGRTREAVLELPALPRRHPVLLPLLVVRCSDWVAPVRERAAAALAEVLDGAPARETAQACAAAWACGSRSRGGTAEGVAAARLDAADGAVWRELSAWPDRPTRRRALAEALQRQALTADEVVDLVLADPDVVVGLRGAEYVLLRAVPPEGSAGPSAPPALVDRLLTCRTPQVRAAAVTVLHRAGRPGAAAPFLADRSAAVRQCARWVLRGDGRGPAALCREQFDRPGRPVTPGAVSGLAECGDRADAPRLRALLAHPGAKVRAAALRGLAALDPLPPDELADVVDRDASPAVLRAAVQALLPDAHRVPRARLDGWLAPGRPGRLRRHAAALLRARGSWDRLEAGLRLVHDADPGLAREALEDLRAWAAGAATGYRRVAAGQLALLGGLLDAAGGSGEDGAGGGPLDGPTVRVLRGALAAARPSG